MLSNVTGESAAATKLIVGRNSKLTSRDTAGSTPSKSRIHSRYSEFGSRPENFGGAVREVGGEKGSRPATKVSARQIRLSAICLVLSDVDSIQRRNSRSSTVSVSTAALLRSIASERSRTSRS